MTRVEVLSVALLETAHLLVEQFRQISSGLNIGLGWHYLLDLCWAAQQLVLVPKMRVADAGAGTGVMQWWLAEQGVDVISVDHLSRRNLPVCFRRRYRVQGWRDEDLRLKPSLRDFLPPRSLHQWHRYPGKLVALLGLRAGRPEIGAGAGTVTIYNQDLASMPDIRDNSIDAVVSISALEHNPPDKMRACVVELMRVLKPGGKLIATLGAAKEEDWFHKASKGWCYTQATMHSIFDLPADCPSNYERYDELFEALRNCIELRDNLASFYFKSGNNGMPWGIWDPKYQPVGVVKVKPNV